MGVCLHTPKEVVGSHGPTLQQSHNNEFFPQDSLCSFLLCFTGFCSSQRNGLHGNYKECKARYGTKPQIECRSSSDCMLKTKNTKCPEHDCIKERSGERKGKSFCTWVVF